MKFLKKYKKPIIVIAVIVAVIIVLGALLPTKQELLSCASPEMQKMIEEDATRSRKRVTETYESLIVINYLSLSTSGAQEVSEHYVGFVRNVYPADEGPMKVVGQMVNYTYRMLGCGENWMHGAKLTVLLTTLTVLFGLLLGTVLALGKISKNKVLSKISSGYIFFFRGTPLLIQLFVVYFTVPGIFGFAWRDIFPASDAEAVYKGAFTAALIAFALNSGAYCAEIVRSAIQSIDKGQFEAAKALGMTYGQTMGRIVIPQSIRRMIPNVSNEFIMILKDASLVFAISLMDITTISKNIMTSEGSYLVFIPALVIYLVITAFFGFIFNKLEKRFSIYE